MSSEPTGNAQPTGSSGNIEPAVKTELSDNEAPAGKTETGGKIEAAVKSELTGDEAPAVNTEPPGNIEPAAKIEAGETNEATVDTEPAIIIERAPTATAAPPAHLWKSPAKLATGLIVLLSIMLLVGVLNVLACFGSFAALEEAKRGAVSAQDAKSCVESVQTFALLAFFMFGVIGVTFIIWQRRLRNNLDALGVRGALARPWWAIGGWLIPFVCLYKPFTMLQQIFKASDPADVSAEGWKTNKGSALIGWWWALWIFHIMALGFAGAIMNLGSADIEILCGFYLMSAAARIIELIAAVLAIIMVKRLTDRQKKKHAAIVAQGVAAAV
ncbi:MAG TPA: DUF4328 domain-containing protein [Planktothrix sp.]|jgi:hypothetical protein